MCKRLQIAVVQVKAGYIYIYISENLLNEIKKTIYSLYLAKEITKNVYNNIINSIRHNTKWILYL